MIKTHRGGQYLKTRDTRELFETKGEAVRYLAGLAMLWLGFGLTCVFWILGAPAVGVVSALAVLVVGWSLTIASSHRLDERLTGRRMRPWPFGFLRLRTQVQATLPSTVTAAARRLDANPLSVTIVIYALLLLAVTALLASWLVSR